MLRGFLLGALVFSVLTLAVILTPKPSESKKDKPQVMALAPQVQTVVEKKVKRRTVTVRVKAKKKKKKPATVVRRSKSSGSGSSQGSAQKVIVQYVTPPSSGTTSEPSPPKCKQGYEPEKKTSGGKVSWSCVKDKTAPTTPPGPFPVAGDSKVELTWGNATDTSGIKKYQVYRDGDLIASTSKTSYTDSGLENGIQYRYAVRAQDKAGNWSKKTETASAKPVSASSSTGGKGPDKDPPSRPNQPTLLLDPEGHSAKITWSASSDNVGIAYYRIYRNGDLIGTSTTPSYTDNDLGRKIELVYTVAALDAAGNISDKSPSVQTYVS